MDMIDQITYAFLTGAAASGMITYCIVTHEKRTVASVRRSISWLGHHHKLTEGEWRRLEFDKKIASDEDIIAINRWAKAARRRLKKEEGIKISDIGLTAEVIICEQFYELDHLAALRAYVRWSKKTNKNIEDIGVLLGRKSKGIAYKENYQREGRSLKGRILADLEAITSGERCSFTSEGINAAKALQARHGEHPDTIAAWESLLKGLASETVDPQRVHEQIDDLLYPDTLEDVEALQQIRNEEFRKLTSHEIQRASPEGIKAAQSLARLRERQKRKNKEEHEAAIAERKQEEAGRQEFREAIAEMNKPIARRYGLPEDTPPETLLAHMRSQKLLAEFERKSPEEREAVLRGLETQNRERSQD